MKQLREYVMKYAERGACKCGRCADGIPNPEQHQPTGHTADLMFFSVSAKEGSDAETLKRLVSESVEGDYGNVTVLDGSEHSYLELGGWIGDQGLALMLMGLGAVLGLWQLHTPKTLFSNLIPEKEAMQMAGMGWVMVKAPALEAPTTAQKGNP